MASTNAGLKAATRQIQKKASKGIQKVKTELQSSIKATNDKVDNVIADNVHLKQAVGLDWRVDAQPGSNVIDADDDDDGMMQADGGGGGGSVTPKLNGSDS